MDGSSQPLDIGKVIRLRRSKMNMSQADLAERLNISRNQVSNIETGKSLPSARVLAALEHAFQTSFEDLLSQPRSSQAVWVVRASGEGELHDGAGQIVERLATASDQRLRPVRLRLEPGEEWTPGASLEGTREHFLYVIAGEIEGWKGERRFMVPERHAAYVVGQRYETWRNSAEVPADFIWLGHH